MLYEFNPKVITFYDFTGFEFDVLLNTKDLDLEKPEY